MKTILILPTLALLGLATAGTAWSSTPEREDGPVRAEWNVDASHTEVNFSVRHFFTPVSGSFHEFDISLDFDPVNVERSQVKVIIEVASIDTRNERRDNHLRSGDFFDVENFPRMTFESASVHRAGPDRMVVTGNLTIKDVTREIDLPITLLGIKDLPPQMQEMFGGITQVASFTADTEVDRRDFGVGVGTWAETAVVGAEVQISIALEANRK
jgi:polyisoprenoid-binding protein YceI